MISKCRIYVIALSAVAVAAIAGGAYYFVHSPTFLSLSRKASPISVGIVNLTEVRNSAKVFQNLKDIMEGHWNKARKEFLEKEQNFRSEYNEIKKLWPDNTGTPPNKYVQKKQELDKRVAEAEQEMQVRKEAINKDLQEITFKIESTIKEILNKLGHEHNVQLILNAVIQDEFLVVLYSEQKMDLTQELITALDLQLPNLAAYSY